MCVGVCVCVCVCAGIFCMHDIVKYSIYMYQNNTTVYVYIDVRSLTHCPSSQGWASSIHVHVVVLFGCGVLGLSFLLFSSITYLVCYAHVRIYMYVHVHAICLLTPLACLHTCTMYAYAVHVHVHVHGAG